MKFSELQTDNAFDAICEIVPYIENITSDEELVSELAKKMNITAETTNAEKMSMLMKKVNVIVPILLKKRREDVFGIVAGINRTDVESVRKQSFIKTLIDIREILQDKEFIDFFKSFVGLAGGV